MIRPATLIDVPRLVELAEQMHGESRFASLAFDADKMAATLAALAGGAGCLLVAEHDGQIIGGFAGWCAEHFFSREKTAGDFGLFVQPDRRGGIAAARLLQAFVAWAREQGVADQWIQAGITTGVHIEATTRLYRSIGFAPIGTVFEFQGGTHVHGR